MLRISKRTSSVLLFFITKSTRTLTKSKQNIILLNLSFSFINTFCIIPSNNNNYPRNSNSNSKNNRLFSSLSSSAINSIKFVNDINNAPFRMDKCDMSKSGSNINEHSTREEINKDNQSTYYYCTKCQGKGTFQQRTKRKKIIFKQCIVCSGAGISLYNTPAIDNNILPPAPVNSNFTVGIIGGGLAGIALGIALQHRRIPFYIFERDTTFNERCQGYGLTMQQGTKALNALGVSEDVQKIGITSKRHLVHKVDGSMIGSWGIKIWGEGCRKDKTKRQNVHIARQDLRRILLNHVEEKNVHWGCKVLSYEENGDGVDLRYVQQLKKHDEKKELSCRVDVLVGADGIRSTTRTQKLKDNLQYLNCVVILGIIDNSKIQPKQQQHPLIDGETVFQTADGCSTRLYIMPYKHNQTMWQLSFLENDESHAIRLSIRGSSALKQVAMEKCLSWHDPIPALLENTPEELISGYPVYDRAMLPLEEFRKNDSRIILIGDAAHPMSPFKGQGANQALLDAISLSKHLFQIASSSSSSKEDCCYFDKIYDFEKDMLQRTAAKVQSSKDAVKFLHSEVAIMEGNITRGAAAAASVKKLKT